MGLNFRRLPGYTPVMKYKTIWHPFLGQAAPAPAAAPITGTFVVTGKDSKGNPVVQTYTTQGDAQTAAQGVIAQGGTASITNATDITNPTPVPVPPPAAPAVIPVTAPDINTTVMVVGGAAAVVVLAILLLPTKKAKAA